MAEVAADETAASRFNRDYAVAYALDADRKTRELRHQSEERLDRIYVGPNGETPADDDRIA